MKGSFYNRSEEPLYLIALTYVPDSYGAGHACFKGGEAKPIEGIDDIIEIAPKQIVPVAIAKTY